MHGEDLVVSNLTYASIKTDFERFTIFSFQDCFVFFLFLGGGVENMFCEKLRGRMEGTIRLNTTDKYFKAYMLDNAMVSYTRTRDGEPRNKHWLFVLPRKKKKKKDEILNSPSSQS